MAFQFHRYMRTPHSEIYSIFLSDKVEKGLAGRVDIHYSLYGLVNGLVVMEQDLSETETEEHKQLMQDRKLTIFAVAENLLMPQETVRRKLKELSSRKLLYYSKSEGLSLGKNFKEFGLGVTSV